MEKLKDNLAMFALSHRYIYRSFDLWAIDRINRMDQKQRNKYQLKRIQDILAYSYLHVPYWRKLFYGLGPLPPRIKSFDDFFGLPILKKETLRDKQDDFFANGVDKISTPIDKTCGSTGVPLKIIADSNFITRKISARVYGWKVYGLKHVSKFIHFLTSPTLKNLGTQILWWEDFPRLHRFIKENKIEAMEGVLHKLLLIAENMEQDDVALGLKFVVSSGEYLSDSARSYLEKVFRCPVFNKYACVEFGQVGYECSTKNTFHPDASIMLVEIVNEKGKPVQGDDMGRIVLTAFDSRIMPLIRYELGDVGRWVYGDCSCGLRTPRFIFEGRGLYFLKLPDGRKYSVMSIFRLFSLKFQKYIKQIQVIQEAVDRITLRIVPSPLYKPKKDDIKFVRAVLRQIDSRKPVTVDVQVVSFIPKSSSGKAQIFLSKI